MDMFIILFLRFLLAAVLVIFIISFIIPFLRLLIRQSSSPLRHLPGPPCPSFFMGNLPEMHDQENNGIIHTWVAKYGTTFVYRGFISGPRLMTTDPVAIAHILGHAYEYPKPDFIKDTLASMGAGRESILTVEGEQHKRQRRILNPAFSASHIQSLSPIFWDKATMLRDMWFGHADSVDANVPESSRIDALSWLARATLDVIGEAGFGYAFNSLSSPSSSNELADAYSLIFSTTRKFRIMSILQVWFPILRRFRRESAAMINAHATVRRVCLQFIAQKRAEVLAELSHDTKVAPSRDLLSLLIKSNTIPSTASPSTAHQQTQMTTQEVLCQISTFIAAGHETTASALTWCLYALARDRRVQRELRLALRELERAAGEEERDVLTARVVGCTYLDWVVREALRLHAPVTSTMRVCARAGGDWIPVSRPVRTTGSEEQRRGEGEMSCGNSEDERRWRVRVAEGDIVSVPIQAVNHSRLLWGEDAWEFKPERWAQPPDTARAVPGLFAHTLTFLNGNGSVGLGNRACIGWRFALTEIKIFLYTLMKDLEFRMDEDMVIEKKVSVVARPFVKSEPHLGNQLPLYIRRAPP